jgi:hypothetical protein
LNFQQLTVLRAITRCRTAALGGHIDSCSQCGHQAISYNSCLMGSNSLWGAGSCNKCKATTRRQFRSPLKVCGC